MYDAKEMQEKRSQFLQKLFKLSEGDEHKMLNMYKIGEELGYDKDTINSIEGYLEGEGLVKWQSTGGYISITHEGVVEVEEALTRTDEPTEHLPSGTSIISIGHMEGSQIIQDSPGAQQMVTINKENIEKIEEVIQKLKTSIDELNLEPQQKNDLNAEVQTIESQMASSKPKTGVIAGCFDTIKDILKGVASSAIATELMKRVDQIYLLLSEMK